MAGAAPDADILYVSGLVAAIFRSPTWVSPITAFVDENCSIFEDQDENKLEYTLIHNAFKRLVDELLEVHLQELSITEEQFTRFCQHGLTGDNEFHRELVEQLLSVDDFLVFKAMMVKRNMQLYHQALQLFGFSILDPTAPSTSGLFVSEATSDMSKEFAAANAEQQRLESEAAELELERMELQRKCVEAELQLAMALSLQLQKRVQLIETLSEILEAISQNAEGASEEAMRAQEGIEALLIQPLFVVTSAGCEDDGEAEAAQAAQQRERAAQAVQASRQQAAERPAPSEDERRARADHLKRQRDALLEKKKQDREQELAQHCETHGETNATRVAGEAITRSADVGKRLVDELQSGTAPPPPTSPTEGASGMRKLLTSQLKQRITGAMD